jgi:hypothetical protein
MLGFSQSIQGESTRQRPNGFCLTASRKPKLCCELESTIIEEGTAPLGGVQLWGKGQPHPAMHRSVSVCEGGVGSVIVESFTATSHHRKGAS